MKNKRRNRMSKEKLHARNEFASNLIRQNVSFAEIKRRVIAEGYNQIGFEKLKEIQSDVLCASSENKNKFTAFLSKKNDQTSGIESQPEKFHRLQSIANELLIKTGASKLVIDESGVKFEF